jgi:hypothetical protein
MYELMVESEPVYVTSLDSFVQSLAYADVMGQR